MKELTFDTKFVPKPLPGYYKFGWNLGHQRVDLDRNLATKMSPVALTHPQGQMNFQSFPLC